MDGSHASIISKSVHCQLWKSPSPIAFSPGALVEISCAPWRKRKIGFEWKGRAVRLMPGEESLAVYTNDSMQLGKRGVTVEAQYAFRAEAS